MENAEVVIDTLNGCPGSWNHSFEECVPKGSDYFQQTLGRAHTRRCSTHSERWEDQDLTIQRRSLKRWGIWRTQLLKNLLSILAFGYEMINEEDDEVEGSRRNLPTKQIKISIHLSFHDIVLLCICLYSVNVLCMIECLH